MPDPDESKPKDGDDSQAGNDQNAPEEGADSAKGDAGETAMAKAMELEAKATKDMKRAQEMVKGAQKSLRDSANAQKVLDDLQAAEKGDIAALRRLPTYDIGVTEEQVRDAERRLADAKAASDGDGKAKSGPLGRKDLPEDVQVELAEGRRDRAERAVAGLRDRLGSLLDKDKKIAYYLEGTGRKSVRNRALDCAVGVLARRAKEAQEDNPKSRWRPDAQDFQAALQETTALLEDYYGEIPSSAPDDSEGSDGNTAGAGPTFRLPTGGRSPLGASSSLHRSQKPLKRVPISEGGEAREDFAEKRMRQIHEELERASEEDQG